MSKKPPLFSMLLLVCIGSSGAVLYTPALPMIAHYFGVSDRLAELSMGIYLLGYALAQLPYGPLSNRFGRKNTLFAGIALAACAAGLSIVSAHTQYVVFLMSRFLYALGAAAGIQVIYTMIGDLYAPPKSIKIASYMTLAFAMSPSISTTIGGFLTQYLGWQSCFYFLLLYCFILMWLCQSLPETLSHCDLNALKLKNIKRDYLELFKDHKVMLVATLVGVAIAFNYTFATIAPALVIKHMHIPPSVYGLLNIIPSGVLILGAILSGMLSHRLHPTRLMRDAALLTLGGALLMLAAFSLYAANLYSLFIPYAMIMLGQPALEANAICLALDYHKNKSTTSSMINFMTLGVCMLFSMLASWLGSSTSLYMPIIFLILTLLILYLYRALKRAYF